MNITIPTLNDPSAYITLCASASIETLRYHPATAGYIHTFFLHAERSGVTNARAWLLGRVLIDLYFITMEATDD